MGRVMATSECAQDGPAAEFTHRRRAKAGEEVPTAILNDLGTVGWISGLLWEAGLVGDALLERIA